jgi:hypothetical protein
MPPPAALGIDGFLNRCVCVVSLSSCSTEVDVENHEVAGKVGR